MWLRKVDHLVLNNLHKKKARRGPQLPAAANTAQTTEERAEEVAAESQKQLRARVEQLDQALWEKCAGLLHSLPALLPALLTAWEQALLECLDSSTQSIWLGGALELLRRGGQSVSVRQLLGQRDVEDKVTALATGTGGLQALEVFATTSAGVVRLRSEVTFMYGVGM